MEEASGSKAPIAEASRAQPFLSQFPGLQANGKTPGIRLNRLTRHLSRRKKNETHEDV